MARPDPVIVKLILSIFQALPMVERIVHDLADAWEKRRKERQASAAQTQLSSDLSAIQKAKQGQP